MTIDEAIKYQHKNHQDFLACMWDGKENNPYDEAFATSIALMKKLEVIENIMLKYNADWYADENNGVPDDEVLECIWNVIQDNGFDIDIEQDYRKGKAEGYNKAIDDFAEILKEMANNSSAKYIRISDYDTNNDLRFYNIEEIAEKLKVGIEQFPSQNKITITLP